MKEDDGRQEKNNNKKTEQIERREQKTGELENRKLQIRDNYRGIEKKQGQKSITTRRCRKKTDREKKGREQEGPV